MIAFDPEAGTLALGLADLLDAGARTRSPAPASGARARLEQAALEHYVGAQAPDYRHAFAHEALFRWRELEVRVALRLDGLREADAGAPED